MNIHDSILYQNIGLPDDILRRKLRGDFSGALRLIDRRLKESKTTAAMKQCLTVQREMLLRTPHQFPYTKEQALEIIRRDIPDFTEEEFCELQDNGDIRWIYVDGQERIFERFYSSITKAVPGMAERTKKNVSGVESVPVSQENPLNPIMRKMKANGKLTYRIRVRATVKLADEQFTPGMFLRVHLPIPAACQQQSDIRIEKLYPENGILSPADAAQRTVCWEKTMEENHAFVAEYSYLHTAVYHNAYEGTGINGSYDFDVAEKAPHIVFTPYIRTLCAELTEGLTDPLAKARAFYDFITKKMHYTYMPDYFVMENIAETCAREHTGDCGVFALLFITLCRCAGIPAQWQSGNTTEPDFIGSHDWARFYVEPYGWLFADPSYGVSANRQGCEERRQFYFGNLDPFRMVANREFQENFTIPKEFWRNDPYDNQSGEMESSDRGFKGIEYSRDKEMLLCQEVTE